MAANIPYGMGFELICIGLLNYMADSYTTATASALASSTFSSSILNPLVIQLARFFPLYPDLPDQTSGGNY
ncbi:hypothetical protein EYZ11_005636 [Aspergillus tanneri]|uniref:Uncharacterized protein n=1 Tax=Aspergillus tanneri TaxID=1220188 RepID=A0A4V3UPF6_9EURO|nr:hypothetical protein EYZ11_005636 [Aspergillus tanneri]